MLTLKEINDVSFGKASFSGYKPEDVDNFIDEVVATFQQMASERDAAKKKAHDLSGKMGEMQEKLSVLAKKIESYRQDEDGIKDAILAAQKMAKASINEATDKARIIVADAQDQAENILSKAKLEATQTASKYAAQTEAKKQELEEMKKQVTAFRASLLEMYKKHLDVIDHIPSFRVKPDEKREKAVEEVPTVKAVKEVEQEALEAPKEEIKEEVTAVAVPSTKEPVELNEKVDYSEEQSTFDDFEDDYDEDEDVDLDMNAFSDIPEQLKKEKESKFANLEFGDGIDVTRA